MIIEVGLVERCCTSAIQCLTPVEVIQIVTEVSPKGFIPVLTISIPVALAKWFQGAPGAYPLEVLPTREEQP